MENKLAKRNGNEVAGLFGPTQIGCKYAYNFKNGALFVRISWSCMSYFFNKHSRIERYKTLLEKLFNQQLSAVIAHVDFAVGYMWNVTIKNK